MPWSDSDIKWKQDVRDDLNVFLKHCTGIKRILLRRLQAEIINLLFGVRELGLYIDGAETKLCIVSTLEYEGQITKQFD